MRQNLKSQLIHKTFEATPHALTCVCAPCRQYCSHTFHWPWVALHLLKLRRYHTYTLGALYAYTFIEHTWISLTL